MRLEDQTGSKSFQHSPSLYQRSSERKPQELWNLRSIPSAMVMFEDTPRECDFCPLLPASRESACDARPCRMDAAPRMVLGRGTTTGKRPARRDCYCPRMRALRWPAICTKLGRSAPNGLCSSAAVLRTHLYAASLPLRTHLQVVKC